MGKLDLAVPTLDPGGHPLLDAEELRFEEGLWQRGAVERDKGAGRAVGERVQQPRLAETFAT